RRSEPGAVAREEAVAEAEAPEAAPGMQEASKKGDRAAAPAHRDWAGIIRARLAGTVPRHAHEDWLIPGLFEPGDAQRQRLLPREPLPAAVLIPLVARPHLTVRSS